MTPISRIIESPSPDMDPEDDPIELAIDRICYGTVYEPCPFVKCPEVNCIFHKFDRFDACKRFNPIISEEQYVECLNI